MSKRVEKYTCLQPDWFLCRTTCQNQKKFAGSVSKRLYTNSVALRLDTSRVKKQTSSQAVSYLSFEQAWTKSHDQNNWFAIAKKSKQIESRQFLTHSTGPRASSVSGKT